MATKVFLLDSTSEVTIGSESKKVASLIQGSSVVSTDATATVGGPTSGVQLQKSSTILTWFSRPLRSVTISGTVTFNLWGLESATQANTGFDVLVERCDQNGNVLSTIIRSERGTELGTTASVNNWTGTPTSTSLNEGDRIKITVFGNDAGGNMGNARSFTMNYGAGTGVNGDSYVQFTETLSIGVVGTQNIPGAESVTVNSNLSVSESLPGTDAASVQELLISTPVYAYFLDHDFTAPDGTNLIDYTEDGISYSKHPSFTVGSFTVEGNRLARDTQTATTLCFASVVSPTIYYEISCDIIDKSDIARTTGIAGWMDSSSDTQICLRRQNGSTWQFLKIINNVGTTITTAPETFSAEAIHSLRLRRIPGTNDFEPFVDDVSLGVFTIDDPEFQSIGKVGLRATGGAQGPTAGFHLDNLKAFYEFVPNEQGAGTDSASVTQLVSVGESGLGTESINLSTSSTLSESGTGTEISSILSSILTSEIAPGIDDALAENLGGDTFFVFADEFGIGIDSVLTNSNISIGETGIGIDSNSTSFSILSEEQGVGTDTTQIFPNVNASETIPGTESLNSLGQIPATETSPGLESIQISFTISEGGISNDVADVSGLILSEEGFSGFDFAISHPFVFVSEIGVGSEDFLVQALQSFPESSPGFETLQIVSSISVGEFGVGLDSVNVESPGQANASETGVGNDSVFVSVQFTVNDTGAGTDNVLVSSLVFVNDLGAGSDSLQLIGQIFGEEGFLGIDEVFLASEFLVEEGSPGTEFFGFNPSVVIGDQGFGIDFSTLSINTTVQQIGAGTDLASKTILGTLEISGKLRISIVNSNRKFARVEKAETRTALVIDNGRTYSEVTNG